MGQFYRTHGKHCHLRSFPTKCQKCGADVLYWECRHGSKLLFNYPIYGKLIRHGCRHSKRKNVKKIYPVIVKKPLGLLEKESPNCVVCGKYFKNENDLNSHLKRLKKIDPFHMQFFDDNIMPENVLSKNKLKKNENIKISYRPKFGSINLKKRNI